MPDIPVWNKCDTPCLRCANTAGFSANTSRDYSLARQAARLELHLRGRAAYRKNARVPGAWNSRAMSGGMAICDSRARSMNSLIESPRRSRPLPRRAM